MGGVDHFAVYRGKSWHFAQVACLLHLVTFDGHVFRGALQWARDCLSVARCEGQHVIVMNVYEKKTLKKDAGGTQWKYVYYMPDVQEVWQKQVQLALRLNHVVFQSEYMGGTGRSWKGKQWDVCTVESVLQVGGAGNADGAWRSRLK